MIILYLLAAAVAVGLFAIGETLWLAAQPKGGPEEVLKVTDSVMMSKEDWKRSWKPWLRGTAIGFPIGAMPAGGALAVIKVVATVVVSTVGSGAPIACITSRVLRRVVGIASFCGLVRSGS